MQETTPAQAGQPGTNQNYRGWQSDIIVDLIKRYGFPAITLNPGASFRGLHDSLVNYGGNEPPMMLCQHEEIAVQIAHGYAKASGKPMAVILHNLVGLLHATMAIYYAYIDRVPIFIIGATGPMDEGRRRPHIDWTHTTWNRFCIWQICIFGCSGQLTQKRNFAGYWKLSQIMRRRCWESPNAWLPRKNRRPWMRIAAI